MDRQSLLEFHKVNKLIKFFIDIAAAEYDAPIEIDDEIKDIITTPRYFFEAIAATFTNHVAYGQEEKIYSDLDPKTVDFYLLPFKNLKILESDRKDTREERLRQIRNCILHHNMEYDDELQVIKLKNKYIETEIDYNNYAPVLFELFSTKSPYEYGSLSFSLLEPEDWKQIKSKEELKEKLAQIKLFTYKMSTHLDKTLAEGTNPLLKDIMDYTKRHIRADDLRGLPLNLEGKIKQAGSQYRKTMIQAINQSPLSQKGKKMTVDLNNKLLNSYLSSIKVRKLNELLPDIYARIEYIGYDKFFELDAESQCQVIISTVIDKMFSQDRNDNDYYNLLLMGTLQDYIKHHPEEKQVKITDLFESTKEYQKTFFNIYKAEDKTVKTEKPIMYRYFLLGQMNYVVTKLKNAIDKNDNDIDMDLYQIDIPNGIKYKSITPLGKAQKEVSKLPGLEQNIEARKKKMLKLFKKQMSFVKEVNPNNRKVDDTKNAMYDNRKAAVELFTDYKKLYGKKGVLQQKKEALDKAKAAKSSPKEIAITEDKQAFFRCFRNALAHSYLDIDLMPGLKAKDLGQTKIKIYDYETFIDTKTGEHIVNKNQRVFEAEMTAKEFFELTECIMKAMDNSFDKDKISLSDIVKDSLFNDLGISESDLHEELIPDERIR